MLSFSLLEGAHSERRGALLGDVVIDVEQAARQARRARRTLDDELAKLMIHGVLHLLGHDHEEAAEARRMRAEERRLWRAVARVTRAPRAAWLAAYAVADVPRVPAALRRARASTSASPLAWLAPACALARALRGLAPRAAALRAGFGAGLAAHALVFHWIYVATVTTATRGRSSASSRRSASRSTSRRSQRVFGGASAWLAARGVAVAVRAAALWVALDRARTFVLTGFPWALLGYAQHQNAPLLGLAPWTGVWGLSFATVLGGAALARLAASGGAGRRSPARRAVAALARRSAPGSSRAERAARRRARLASPCSRATSTRP